MSTPASPALPEVDRAGAPPATSGSSLALTLQRRLTAPVIGLLLCIPLFGYGVATVKHHGLTYDAPALFYAGDRTLFWATHHGVPDALDFDAKEPAGFHSEFPREPEASDVKHYPVFPALVAAVFAAVLHGWLGATSSLDGHHIGLLALDAAVLFVICLYACRLFGRVGGAAATFAMALYPSGLGHAFNNAKDWPCATLYAAAVLAAGVGLVKGRGRHLAVAGVLVGLGLACKLNAVFVLPTLLLWTPLAYLFLYRRGPRTVTPQVVGGYLLAPYLALAVFFATWPWLYQGRLPDWWRHINDYVQFMVDYGVGQRPTWSAYALRCVLYMSPPVVLIAAALSLLWLVRGTAEQRAVWLLVALWFALPVLRVLVPHSNFYDANRHFIEYAPALAALAGIGASATAELVQRWLASPRVRGLLTAPRLLAGLALVGAAGVIWPIAQYTPYEYTYFNILTGGLGGAQARALFMVHAPADSRANGTEGDYWFSSSRDAMDALLKAEPAGAHWRTFGLCGVHTYQFEAAKPAGLPTLVDTWGHDFDSADAVYISPREMFGCGWSRVRQLEAERPILHREERGGGLIYELFGPRDGKPHPVVSPQNPYTDGDFYHRADTQ